MALPWFKVASNIGQHDKILDLLERRGGRGIAFSFIAALGYSVGNGTDGDIPKRALPFIHATPKDMYVMQEVGLMAPTQKGWHIRNFDKYQLTSEASEAALEMKRLGGRKTACKNKGHAPDCKCWESKP